MAMSLWPYFFRTPCSYICLVLFYERRIKKLKIVNKGHSLEQASLFSYKLGRPNRKKMLRADLPRGRKLQA